LLPTACRVSKLVQLSGETVHKLRIVSEFVTAPYRLEIRQKVYRNRRSKLVVFITT
jgi:hypothetical protein